MSIYQKTAVKKPSDTRFIQTALIREVLSGMCFFRRCAYQRALIRKPLSGALSVQGGGCCWGEGAVGHCGGVLDGIRPGGFCGVLGANFGGTWDLFSRGAAALGSGKRKHDFLPPDVLKVFASLPRGCGCVPAVEPLVVRWSRQWFSPRPRRGPVVPSGSHGSVSFW